MATDLFCLYLNVDILLYELAQEYSRQLRTISIDNQIFGFLQMFIILIIYSLI